MKKRLMIFLLMIITLTAISITLFIGGYSAGVIGNFLERDRNDVISQVRNRFKLFDNLMFAFENGMKDLAVEAIKSIDRAVPGVEYSKKASPGYLRELAGKYGVSEIYFIDRSGLIYNTSFTPDMNFNLFRANSDFVGFLNSVFGRGEIVIQRISMSMNTGKVNLYAYYSPAGSDYILEISIGLTEYLDSKYEKGYYDKLKPFIFGNILAENSFLRSIDIYSITGLSSWSFVNPGKSFTGPVELIGRLQNEKEILIRDGETLKVMSHVSFDTKTFGWSDKNLVLEIAYDFSMLENYRGRLVYFSLLISIIIIIIAFLIASWTFNRHFVRRVMAINTGLQAISEGDYTAAIDDSGSDEFSNICKNINSMSDRIEKHVRSLENLMPICANCKKIRDDKGYWNQVEQYLLEHSGMRFSHGICPECTKKLYPDYYEKMISEAALNGEKGESGKN